VKNTLAKLAVGDAGLAAVSELLVGPTAVAFVTGDPVEAAKCLRDFARAHPLLVIKGGVMEGRALSADEVRRLADLQSREVLLAMLAGAMQASLAQAAGLFAAPLAQAARVLAALRDQLPAGTDATPEASADAPAEAEAPAEPEASADAPAEPEASADAPAEVDAPAEPEASAEPDTTDVEPTPAAE
jgi:large subunit ribosomal protein L10